jgi:hypothetical protein|tara:strand:- start:5248 stop:6270 length:1023 start_codon:yes stop_codon:yes gene_type:complete
MPAQVIITEPARNIVEITTTTNSVAITEQVNTVSVAASTVSGAGGGSTSGIINITNTIGDAIAGETYPQGTSLETIIRDIVAPFFEPTVATISYSASGASQVSGNDLLVECGLSNTISSVDLVFTNPENIDTATPVTFTDTSDLTSPYQQSFNVSSFSTPTTISLSPSYTIDTITTPFVRNFRVQIGFKGDDGTGSIQTLTKDFKIKHRHRFFVVSASATSITNLGVFFGAGNTQDVLSTLEVDPTLASQSIAVQCNANTANADRFTWIIVEKSGTLGEVAAEVNGRGVADYTDSFLEFTNGGSFFPLATGTATPNYRAYRSIQPGAFDSDITLNIEIKH